MPHPSLDHATQPCLPIEVRLFAAAAQMAGTRSVTLSVPSGSGMPQLIALLIAQHPQLESLARVSRWALDTDFVAVDFVIEQSGTIAMIPPVSGG